MFDRSASPIGADDHPTGSPHQAGGATSRVAQPLMPRHTAWLERTLASEIVPRLMYSRRSGPVTSTVLNAPPRHFASAEVEAFVAAILRDDEAVALGLLRSYVGEGTPVESLYLDLLAPCAERLGELWADDSCDFMEVTVAMGRMQQMLRELSRLFLSDAGRIDTVGSVLLTCLPGEQHTLGVIMVGEFLLRDGWRVQLGAPWSERDLQTMVEHEWFDVVGYSLGCSAQLPSLKRQIRRIRAVSLNPSLKVMVGGRTFADDASLVDWVGADARANDAREAPSIARSLLTPAARVATPAPWSSQAGLRHDDRTPRDFARPD